MRAVIAEAKEALDSVGGIIECAVTGLPAGLGDPMLDGMENRIARIVFAIPAVNPVDYNRVQELAASRARNPARKNAELVPEETSPARLDIDDFGDVTNN